MKKNLIKEILSLNKIIVVLLFLLSFESLASPRIGVFVSPLSLLSGGRGGIELYLGKRWAFGGEYSYQNTFIDDSTAYDPYLYFFPKIQGGDIITNYGPRLSFFFKGYDQKGFSLFVRVFRSNSEVLYANKTLNYTQETTIGILALGYLYPRKRWFYRLNMNAGSYISAIQRKDAQSNQVAANLPPVFFFLDFETGIYF